MEIFEKGLLIQKKYKTILDLHGIDTPIRLAHFFCQISHESGLVPRAENLNYSSAGLLATFGKYVQNSPSIADKYQRQPERIANLVYANRNGNGNEASGEGWKYRGRGFIQITGKENYFKCANDTDIDCLKNPDLLLEEANAMVSALWFWNSHNLNKLADADNIEGITKAINGGLTGIDDRKQKLILWKKLI